MKKQHMFKWIGMGLLIAGLATTGCLKLTDGYCDECDLGLNENGFTLNEFGYSAADIGDWSGGSSSDGNETRPVAPPDDWPDTDWNTGSNGDWGSDADGDADGDPDWGSETDVDTAPDIEEILANCSADEIANIVEQCGSDASCIMNLASEC